MVSLTEQQYLVIYDKGYGQTPLNLVDKMWKAETRKKEYEIGWSSFSPKIIIREIKFL